MARRDEGRDPCRPEPVRLRHRAVIGSLAPRRGTAGAASRVECTCTGGVQLSTTERQRPTITQRVEQYLRDHPEATDAEVAQAVGCALSTPSRVRRQLARWAEVSAEIDRAVALSVRRREEYRTRQGRPRP